MYLRLQFSIDPASVVCEGNRFLLECCYVPQGKADDVKDTVASKADDVVGDVSSKASSLSNNIPGDAADGAKNLVGSAKSAASNFPSLPNPFDGNAQKNVEVI